MHNPAQVNLESDAPAAPAKRGWLARFIAWWNDPVEELCLRCDGAMRHIVNRGYSCEDCGGTVGHPLGSAGLRGKRPVVPRTIER